MKTMTVLAMAGLISAQAALAQGAMNDANDVNNASPGLPAATHSGNVIFVSGGIGLNESTAMQRAARDYPLEMEFLLKAAPRDEYTANVHVKVENAQHAVVLDTVAQGPFLLAKLPSGHYRVEATQAGLSKLRDVTVKNGSAQQKLVFVWPAA